MGEVTTEGLLDFTIDGSQSTADRIAAFQAATGMWVGDVEGRLPEIGDIEGSFEGRLVRVPKGKSRQYVLDRIAGIDSDRLWSPAEPEHMLGYGTRYGKDLKGYLGHFPWLMGLGARSSVFGSLRTNTLLGGRVYFFYEMSPTWKDHVVVGETRALAVRRKV